MKIKQIVSGNNIYGKAIITDGSGHTIFQYSQSEKGTIFPSNPSNGDNFYHTTDTEQYYYDSSRSKWLSNNKNTIIFGRSTLSDVTGGYLGIADLYHTSTTGILLQKNGTIVSASIINENTVTRTIQARINNSNTRYVDLSLSGQNSTIINDSNLDFSVGEFLNIYISSGIIANMDRISVLIEFVWRH